MYLVTEYKKTFDEKELQIKMYFSLLNVSNDSSIVPRGPDARIEEIQDKN